MRHRLPTVLICLDDGSPRGRAAHAQSGTTSRVSVDAGGGDANGASESPSVSADGRYIAFVRRHRPAAGGHPEFGDVFLRDRVAGTTTLVNADMPASRPSATTAATSPFWRVGAPDGPTHAFVGPRGGHHDPGGRRPRRYPGQREQRPSSISGDGRQVAFESFASNLVPGDGNGQPDVFVRDLDTGAIVRANVDTAGGDSGFAEFEEAVADSPDVLSDDGRHVVFKSASLDLVPGDDDGFASDVFVRDLVEGVTTLASDARGGGRGEPDDQPQRSAGGLHERAVRAHPRR